MFVNVNSLIDISITFQSLNDSFRVLIIKAFYQIIFPCTEIDSHENSNPLLYWLNETISQFLISWVSSIFWKAANMHKRKSLVITFLRDLSEIQASPNLLAKL